MVEGYFGIGILNPKTETNVGTLWRSAAILKASFIFVIGRRMAKQSSDTQQAFRSIPLYYYETFTDFYKQLPYGCQLVGVELTEEAIEIQSFRHPERCIYLLGAEDHGLTPEAIRKCHKLIKLPGEGSLNVAVAGALVMYDRMLNSKS